MRARAAGVNLTETIIAVFLISLGVLVVAGLIQAGTVANRKAERAYVAAFLAEKHLERLRHLSSTTATFEDWSSLDGTVAPDPEFPDYQVRIDSEIVPLYSPSSALEARVPVDAERRKMTASYRKVRVSVGWDPTRPEESVKLWTLIGAPGDRELSSITLTPTSAIPAPVPINGTVDFTATALDSAGKPIKDVFLNWSVTTNTSVGTLPTVARDGSQAKFQHYYRKDSLTGDDIHGPAGECSVNVTGSYHSNVSVRATQALQLGP